jgi:NRPS condensation-like uncharacterized protein
MDYAAEAFDQVQRLFDANGFNDHELHCVLRFESGPDAELLRKAVIASIEAIPILGARYVDGARPRWISLDPADFGRAFVVARTPAEFDELVVARVDEGLGPQVRVGVLDASARAVALNVNHMACDAAGLKSYLYFLCEIYSRLTADPAYRPAAILGDRSMRGVLERFGAGAKFKFLFAPGKQNNFTGADRFPLDESAEARPFILTRKLERERTAALKQFGRAHGATLNDVVLTAFCRCLFKALALRPGAELSMPMMVDMRRYLKETEEFTSLTNLTSMATIRLDYRPEESFEGALARVKALMDEKKRGDLGLDGFVKLDLVYRLLGDRIANRLLRRRLNNPPHLHDEHWHLGFGANRVRRSAPARRVHLRLDKAQTLLPARGERLRRRTDAERESLRKRGRPGPHRRFLRRDRRAIAASRRRRAQCPRRRLVNANWGFVEPSPREKRDRRLTP